MPKKLVKLNQQIISPSYGIVEAGEREFDTDYANHLIEIGTATEVQQNTGPAPSKNKMDNGEEKHGDTVPAPKKKTRARKK